MNTPHRVGLAGILVALATLIVTAYPTWRDRNFYWFDSLQYQFDKYECATRHCKIQARISNRGFSPEENVEVQFPNATVGRDEIVHVSIPYTHSKRANGTVLHLGTLHRDDTVLIALDTKDVGHFDNGFPEFNLRVTSQARLASFAGIVGREDPFAKPAWFRWLEWFLVLFIGLLVSGAAYFLFFESARARRKRLADEVERLRKQIGKLEAIIASLPGDETASSRFPAPNEDARRN